MTKYEKIITASEEKLAEALPRVENLLYGIEKQSKKEYINAILADLNGCDSLITVGLEEFYEENNREENDND